MQELNPLLKGPRQRQLRAASQTCKPPRCECAGPNAPLANDPKWINGQAVQYAMAATACLAAVEPSVARRVHDEIP